VQPALPAHGPAREGHAGQLLHRDTASSARHRASLTARPLFARKPKCRIRAKPPGRTWRRNLSRDLSKDSPSRVPPAAGSRDTAERRTPPSLSHDTTSWASGWVGGGGDGGACAVPGAPRLPTLPEPRGTPGGWDQSRAPARAP